MPNGKLYIFAGYFAEINGRVKAGFVNEVTDWGFNELYKGEMTFVTAQIELAHHNYHWMQVIDIHDGRLVTIAEYVKDIGWKMKETV